MASKRQVKRRAAAKIARSCARKIRHESEGAAYKHTEELIRKHGRQPDTPMPYPCPCCGGWHVGR